MAGARPEVLSLKRVAIPEELVKGAKFVRWEEDPSPTATPVTLSLDPGGHYLTYSNQLGEVDLLDTSCIRDARTGRAAKTPKDKNLCKLLQVGEAEALEQKTLTLVYGSDFVNVNYLNFVCGSVETAGLWSSVLLQLCTNLLHLNGSVMGYLRKAHTRLQLLTDVGGKLQMSNLLKMFGKEERERVQRVLEVVGMPYLKTATLLPSAFPFPTFFQFYVGLMERRELRAIFNQLTSGKSEMSSNEFMDFLNNEQRDPRLNEILYPYTTAERARELIEQYEQDQELAAKGLLSFDGFLRYTLSEENGIVSLERYELADDLSHPLNHYFINSSHNTYLTGHQLAGKSSVEIYRQALLAGCRCVELDFWNGKMEEPVVVHGYTLVPDIPAKDVLEAIADSAFRTSPLPLILSFENHCNQKQQAKIAQYCRDFFGEMLLDVPLERYPLQPGQPLPSPQDLLKRILIKNKKYRREGEDDDSSSSDESDSQRESAASTELSSLVNYVQPVHFHSFEHAQLRAKAYEMTSFDERQAAGLLKERPVEFVDYNKVQMTRVYPRGTRVDSSNFMPHLFWNAGCQLVALNYQTLDLGMQLNIGLFEQNARSGYLLKPECMRRRERRFDPFAENTVDGIIAGMVTVRVMSGQFLSEKKVGVYVEVEMYGLPTDTVRGRWRTRLVQNGVNPVWDEGSGVGGEAFVFKKVVLPELATLRIAAYEEGAKLIGHRVLPVLALRPGYRHCMLRNELGQPLLATLFLQIRVQDFVPDGLSELAAALANPIKAQSEREKRERQMNVFRDSLDEDDEEVPPPGGSPAAVQPRQPSEKRDKKASFKRAPVAEAPPPAATAPTLKPTTSVEEPTVDVPEIHAEPLAKFMESKQIRDKKQELDKKLESLRRKHEKERRKGGSKLVKRASSRSMEEPSMQLVQEQLIVEREILERGWEEIFSLLEKAMKSSQSLQLKQLKSQQDSTTSSIMKKLSSERKEEVRKLSKKTREKNELDRLKREVTSRLVEKGVSERSRMEKSYEKLLDGLEREHEAVRRELEEKRRVNGEEVVGVYLEEERRRRIGEGENGD